MADVHPAAAHHVPAFITAPGETDVLMVVMSVILALSVVMFGILYLRLHSLPERMAHKAQKLQFEIVAVLCLISLFTHMHIFWIIGLVLAMVELPDFGNSLNRIAGSAEKIAGFNPGEGAVPIPSRSPSGDHAGETARPLPHDEPDQDDIVVELPKKTDGTPPKQKELIHA